MRISGNILSKMMGQVSEFHSQCFEMVCDLGILLRQLMCIILVVREAEEPTFL